VAGSGARRGAGLIGRSAAARALWEGRPGGRPPARRGVSRSPSRRSSPAFSRRRRAALQPRRWRRAAGGRRAAGRRRSPGSLDRSRARPRQARPGGAGSGGRLLQSDRHLAGALRPRRRRAGLRIDHDEPSVPRSNRPCREGRSDERVVACDGFVVVLLLGVARGGAAQDRAMFQTQVGPMFDGAIGDHRCRRSARWVSRAAR
jgi:hypothetical protein